MYKIIELNKTGLFINIKRGHLEIKDQETSSLIPLDDIRSIIISGYGQTITTVAIREMLERKILVIMCNEKFMPIGLMQSSFEPSMLNKRIHLQVNMSEPFKKNIWKEIVAQKIYFQGEVLKYFFNNDEGLFAFSKNVLSGDTDNKEAQAAKRYWPILFTNFKRSDEHCIVNSALDYGYIVLRACVARVVVAQGLHPSFGVFHISKENNFCLVDDLIEVFRPVVDIKIRNILNEFDIIEMSPLVKKQIIEFIYEDFIDEKNEKVPLYRAIELLVNSFCSSLENNKCKLNFLKSIISVKK